MNTVSRSVQSCLHFNVANATLDPVTIHFNRCGAQQITLENLTLEGCLPNIIISAGDFCQFDIGIWDIEIVQNNQSLLTSQIKVKNE